MNLHPSFFLYLCIKLSLRGGGGGAGGGAGGGFIDDVIVDTKCATVVSIVIFGRPGLCGLIGKCQDYIIPWEKIELIGEDTVIISCQTPKPVKKPKKPHFGAKF